MANWDVRESLPLQAGLRFRSVPTPTLMSAKQRALKPGGTVEARARTTYLREGQGLRRVRTSEK